jgi:hypothetical protein
MVNRVIRLGTFVNADEAFEAWTSGDLRRMLAARSVATNPIDRHFLLQGIVKETYKRRVDPEMRRVCIETRLIHLSEFGTIGPALEKDMGGSLPRVPSFAWLATAMAEDGQIDEAVRVCEQAARLGAADGTQGGYLARGQKLRKKHSKVKPVSVAR